MKSVFFSTIYLLIVLFFASPAQAALPETAWRTGHLTLWDKTVLEGELSYNWCIELVLFRQSDGRVRTFSADQVSQFSWFDFADLKERDFVSLSNPAKNARPGQIFVEVCMDGPLRVVRRLRPLRGFFKGVFSHPAHFTDQPAFAQNTDYFDYFVYDAGRLRALDRFYIDIYRPLMTTYDKELQAYVAIHNINDRTLPGRLVLIDYYNFLTQQDSRSASARQDTGTPN